MDFSKYTNKKLKIIFNDGSKIVRKICFLNWIDSHFIELKENGTKHIIPIKSIIRMEVIE